MSITPREILLARHRALESKLDRIRQAVVAAEVGPAAGVGGQTHPRPEARPRTRLWGQVWLELFWSCRGLWAGLAATWAVIFLVNLSILDQSPTAAPAAGMWSAKSFGMMLEQERMLTELADGPQPVVTPAVPSAGPRSQIITRKLDLGSA